MMNSKFKLAYWSACVYIIDSVSNFYELLIASGLIMQAVKVQIE